MDVLDPAHLRALRKQQDELFGPAKLPAGVAEAYKALASTEAALGVNRTTAEAILGYKPGDAAMEAAQGFIKRSAVTEATLGLHKPGAVTDAALGSIPNSLQNEIDRATATILRDETLFRSPARAVLQEIGAHPDVKPANRGRRVAKPSAPVPSDNPAKSVIAISSVADIGQRVRQARLGMNMTQQRFADMAGVGRRFLIELEHGKASLEIGLVLAVCQAAGIKLAITT
jgi:y4mF family transcriptional regulator